MMWWLEGPFWSSNAENFPNILPSAGETLEMS